MRYSDELEPSVVCAALGSVRNTHIRLATMRTFLIMFLLVLLLLADFLQIIDCFYFRPKLQVTVPYIVLVTTVGVVLMKSGTNSI